MANELSTNTNANANGNVGTAKQSNWSRLRTQATAVTTLAVQRLQWMVRAGLSFAGRRDLYRVFGYDTTLTYPKYLGRYYRDGIAKRVVDAYPQATWRSAPIVYDDDKDTLESEFEKAWLKHAEAMNVFQVLERLDKLAGLGDYAVLVIGAPGDPKQPMYKMRKGKDPLYLAPYGMGSASIATWDSDPTSERYGQPIMYQIGMTNLQTSTGIPNSFKPIAPVLMHYTRVIHVAENLLEGRIYGTPRLEAVWNDIDDLRKVTGGASEMFYIAGNRGLHVKFDPDYIIDDKQNVHDEVDEYIHEMTRMMITQGVEIESLGSDVADPRGAAITNLQMISAGTGIPMRILTGSEMGQLASMQDRDNWNERITERKNSFALPMILKVYVQCMIDLGVLPKPKNDQARYEWPDLMAYSAEQRSTQALREATAEQYHANAVKNGAPLLTDAEARSRWYDLDGKPKQPINEDMHPIHGINVKKAQDYQAGKAGPGGEPSPDDNPNAPTSSANGNGNGNGSTHATNGTSASARADATIKLKQRRSKSKTKKSNENPQLSDR